MFQTLLARAKADGSLPMEGDAVDVADVESQLGSPLFWDEEHEPPLHKLSGKIIGSREGKLMSRVTGLS